MKKTIIKLCLIAFIATLNFNCTQSEESSEITPEQSLEAALLEVEQYSKDNNNANVSFTLKRENSLFTINTIEVMRSDLAQSRRQGDRFHVACYDDEGNETNYTICPDKLCAAEAILECTDSGGCAEICEVQTDYFAPA